ncbi:MAG: type II CAAX endopeptidase family protein [Saprospiraceae bacterium]
MDPSLSPTPSKIPLLMVFIFLFISMVIGALLGSLLSLLMSQVWGISLTAMQEINTQTPLSERQFFRTVNLLSHLATFTLPALITAYLFYKREWLSKLHLAKSPTLFFIFGGIIWLLLSFPFTQVSFWVNQQLPLPEWATSLENQAEDMIAGLLTMNSIWELFFTLAVMALVPAIGEELVFRGIIQRELVKRMKYPHAAIWIASFIFSAFHFQFEGFIPRLILGAVLGYLYYWSRNLWIPILIHLFYNGMQIVAYYLYKAEMENLSGQTEMPNLWLGLGSLLFLIAGGWYLSQHKITQDETLYERIG